MSTEPAGDPRFGAWITTACPEIAAELVAVGYDYIGIDCQHSLIGLAEAGRLLREFAGSPVKAAVRVASHSPSDIGKVLDSGADIVIVPLVNTAQEAAAIAGACRLPPDGRRSFGPIRRDLSRQARDINARVTCLAMIETAEGLANADEILAVAGIDGIYVGPRDLSLSLGLSDTLVPPSPELLSVARGLADSARRVGKIAGFHAGSGANASHYLACGFTFISLAADTALLRGAAATDLSAARTCLDLSRTDRGPRAHRVQLTPTHASRQDVRKARNSSSCPAQGKPGAARNYASAWPPLLSCRHAPFHGGNCFCRLASTGREARWTASSGGRRSWA